MDEKYITNDVKMTRKMSVKTDKRTGRWTEDRRIRGAFEGTERERKKEIDAQCYVDRIRKELLQSTTRQKINLRPLSDER